MNLKTIIIDDEPGARESLAGLIRKFTQGVEVVATAASAVEGVKAIRAHQPDLIFLDIEMPNATGFDLLELVGDREFEVIFITAYNQYAIKAIKFAALDYLLKPVSPSELREAIARAIENRKKRSNNENLRLLVENLREINKKPEKIILPVQEGLKVFELKDIVRCQSEVNYTWFYFANEKKILISKTLKEYQEMLEESGFVRIHQSHLINLDHVSKYNKKGRGGEVEMSDGAMLPISRDRKKEFLEKMGELL